MLGRRFENLMHVLFDGIQIGGELERTRKFGDENASGCSAGLRRRRHEIMKVL